MFFFLPQILDMCAAPGSKTAQLIEMLHADMDVPFPGKEYCQNLLIFVFVKNYFVEQGFPTPGPGTGAGP